MAGKLPTYDRLMNPVLHALQALGGSGSIEEIDNKVIELEKLPEELTSRPHNPEESNETEIAYRLAWARTYLKKYGLLENSSRGIWSLVTKDKELTDVNPPEVVRAIRALGKKRTNRAKIPMWSSRLRKFRTRRNGSSNFTPC
jgi:restriction system protein